MSTREVCIAGHRGNAATAPENTLAAFEQALDLGADAIETDVRLSRDGIPILFHDPDFLRITGEPTTIAESSLRELQLHDIGQTHGAAYRGARIPTLAETAALCRDRATLILDLKAEDCLEAIAEACAQADFAADQLQICAWTERQANDARRWLPQSRLFHLTRDPLEDSSPNWFDELAARGFRGLSQRFAVLEADTVKNAHERGLEVFTWTIDTGEELREALSYGVDGIISNDPGGLIAAFAESPAV